MSAFVTVDGVLISEIGKGLLVLAAISKDDTEKDFESMAHRISKAKLWDDTEKDPVARVSPFIITPSRRTLNSGSGSSASGKSKARSSVYRNSPC